MSKVWRHQNDRGCCGLMRDEKRALAPVNILRGRGRDGGGGRIPCMGRMRVQRCGSSSDATHRLARSCTAVFSVHWIVVHVLNVPRS